MTGARGRLEETFVTKVLFLALCTGELVPVPMTGRCVV